MSGAATRQVAGADGFDGGLDALHELGEPRGIVDLDVEHNVGGHGRYRQPITGQSPPWP